MRQRAGSVVRLAVPVKAAVQRFSLPILIILSTTIILLGKADLAFVERARIGLSDAVAPLLEAAARPLEAASKAAEGARGVLALYDENQRLREENARLLQWQDVAQRLETENAELRSLLKYVPETNATFVSARVIAHSGGAYVRSVLVNAGRRDSVERGQAATTGEGLVGRITEVGERSARVLLITDRNSRLPVRLESSRERAILAGDNSRRPVLQYLPPRHTVQVGERVVTSGDGGVFPPGLPVGVIAALENGVVRVEPFVELTRLDYLRIVDFGLEGGLPDSAMPQPKPSKAARRRLEEAGAN